MKYVIIGNSGHYPQVLEAMRSGETCAPCAVAPGSRAEDVRALAAWIARDAGDALSDAKTDI